MSEPTFDRMQIVAATLTLVVQIPFEDRAPRSITISPPPDHPAILELLAWNEEQLLATLREAGPS